VIFKFNPASKEYECDKEEEHQRLRDRMKRDPNVLENTLA
jgi:hypothetical protein